MTYRKTEWYTGPLEGEEWRQLNGTHYSISNLGRARSNYGKTKLLKQRLNHGGYFKVSINGHNKFAHRLVAELFVVNILLDGAVNHKDGNRQNNRADNLEWVTHQQNAVDAVKRRDGQWRTGNSTPVRCIDRDGKGRSFSSCGEASRWLNRGTDPGTIASIYACVKGKSKRFLGWRWELDQNEIRGAEK